MEYLIFFFLIGWKYECDMEKHRRRWQREEREFEKWLLNEPYTPGSGAAIAAASQIAACCLF